MTLFEHEDEKHPDPAVQQPELADAVVGDISEETGVDIYFAPKYFTVMSAGLAAMATAESVAGVRDSIALSTYRVAGFAAIGAACGAIASLIYERGR